MRKIIFPLAAAFALISYTGCTKGGINSGHYSGSYHIYKYELRYFNGNNTEDSTFTVENVAHLGLYDDKSDAFNDCVYSSTSVPRSWVDNGVGLPSTWYADNGRGNTITLASDVGVFVVYTVEKESRRKYKWTLAEVNASGGLNYIETLYLEKE